MKCTQCGNEINEGELFCSQCGQRVVIEPAPVTPPTVEEPVISPISEEPAVSQTAEPDPVVPPVSDATPVPDMTQDAQTPPPVIPPIPEAAAPAGTPGGNKIVLQIFAGIFAVIFALSFLRTFFESISGLFRTITSIRYPYMGIFASVMNLLGNLLALVTSVVALATAAVLLLTVLKWSAQHAKALMLTLAEVAILRLLIIVIKNIIYTIYFSYLYGGTYIRPAWHGTLTSIITTVILLGGYYAILYLMNAAPSFRLNQDDLVGAPKETYDLARGMYQEHAAKKPQPAPSSTAYTNPNPAYNNPNPAYTNPNPAYNNPNPAYTNPNPNYNNQAYANPNPGASYAVHTPVTTNRSLLLYILLSLITCGIYSWYFIYKLAKDTNTVCDGDGGHTAGLLPYILLSIITCGIYSFVWYYKLGNRLAANSPRYGMYLQENGTTVLLWIVLGTWLCGLGYFFGLHIIIKNINALCNAYNAAAMPPVNPQS